MPYAETQPLVSSSDSELGKALQLFFLETSRLEEMYQSLQEEFKAIQQELQQTHTKLYGKLAELEFVTRYLDAILQHMSQGLLFVDLSGNVTTYNQAAEDILGIPGSQVLFHPFWQAFADDSFGMSLKEYLRKPLYTPKTLFTNWTLPNGKKYELEIEVSFISLGAPTICQMMTQDSAPATNQGGALFMIRNITEICRLQLLAQRTNRLKDLGEMAARVAHEIRNPLGGIKGFATLLYQDLQNHPDLQQMASQIIEGTDGLNRLVSNILNYTRPFQLQLESTDLVSFLKEVVQLVQADPNLHSVISFDIQLPQLPLKVPLDAQLFKSAVLNLLVNALEAMPQGGKLTLELKSDLEYAQLTVSDTGVGISEENLEKIFSPFFTTKDVGNGFGLSEVHKIIQAHGGTIEVQSKLQEGTIFIIKIPLKLS
jgi:PAS domain S-box-containing protein